MVEASQSSGTGEVLPLSSTVLNGSTLNKEIQKQSNDEKEVNNLQNRLYAQCKNLTLRCELKRRGLTTSGNKDALVWRLLDSDADLLIAEFASTNSYVDYIMKMKL